MRPRSHLAIAAVVTGTALLALPAGAPAKKRSCKPKKEQAGCVLKTARYAGSTFNFSVSLGVGVGAGAGAVQCPGPNGTSSSRNVIWGGFYTQQKPVKNPVIGQTYHRHFDINADSSPLVKNQVALDLTVKITSATKMSMTFKEQIVSTSGGETSTCSGSATEPMKRVS